METKKIYEQPQFEEVKMAVTQMLCESGTGGSTEHAPGMHEINDDF